MRSVVEIGASVPAFLGKLWKLVNDTETNHLISWSPGGKTFVINNQADFARELLPLYYKHNNMASFIRQLNMYGFHKVTSVENGGLRFEKDEIEFSHPCFMKGHAYLLEHIKRKIANSKSLVPSNEAGEIQMKTELMGKMLSDVKQMQTKQESLDAQFSAMKHENEALWREVAILRQKHGKQQQIVNNLVQFLMTLIQQQQAARQAAAAAAAEAARNQQSSLLKRPYQLMIDSAAHNTLFNIAIPDRLIKAIKLDNDALMEELNEENQEDGPTIHELPHDDVLHNENSQDGTNESYDFSVPLLSNASNRSSTDPSTSTYHVTMVDGDDTETGGQRVTYPANRRNSGQVLRNMPIVTSPSPNNTPAPSNILDQAIAEQVIVNNINGSIHKPKTGTTRNNTTPSKGTPQRSYNIIQPSADLKLPADIFASDDSVGDVGMASTDDISIQKSLADLVQESLLTNTKDKMLGGVDIKLEKPSDLSKTSKKSKKSHKNNENINLNLADIKTELQDDIDWNNMTLATVNNRNGVERFQSRNDIDNHLESMQTDLESLRELLRSDAYAFDSNTLLGNGDARLLPPMTLNIPSYQPTSNNYLFGSEDPFYGIPYNNMEERPKSANNVDGNELISYTGNIPDLEDINLPDLECDNSQEAFESPVPDSSTLNTPQVQIRSPSFAVQP